METLQVKHLTPYLPYGLMTNYGKLVSIQTECIVVKEAFLKFEQIDKNGFHSYHSDLISNTKPILKAFNVGKCVGIDYNLMQDLLKNHFDVFGLIDKGLAIDIDSMKIFQS